MRRFQYVGDDIRTTKMIRHHSGDIPAGALLKVTGRGLNCYYCQHPDNPNVNACVPFDACMRPFGGPAGPVENYLS